MFVSGSLGDAALGLALRKNARLADVWGLSPAEAEHLRRRYLRPQPRLGLGPALRERASAANGTAESEVDVTLVRALATQKLGHRSGRKNAETAFALAGFDGEGEFGRRLARFRAGARIRSWDAIPNGAEHFGCGLIRDNKTGVAFAAPAFDVTGVFGLLENVA